MKAFMQKNGDYFYFVFRVLIGLLFMQHGVMKVFGGLGGTAQPLVSMLGLAGLIELIGGLLIALGFFTRLASLISALCMVAAYFIAHASKGFFPVLNGGELAVVYFAAFLALMAFGARKWSLEKALLKKEVF